MVEVVMCIACFENEVVIVRRAKSEGNLLWQFPGGGIEENETIFDTAIRELKEETNLDGEVIEIIGTRIHPYSKKEIAYIAMKVNKNEIIIGDPDLDIGLFVNKNDLSKYFTTPLYDKVQDYLNNLK